MEYQTRYFLSPTPIFVTGGENMLVGAHTVQDIHIQDRGCTKARIKCYQVLILQTSITPSAPPTSQAIYNPLQGHGSEDQLMTYTSCGWEVLILKLTCDLHLSNVNPSISKDIAVVYECNEILANPWTLSELPVDNSRDQNVHRSELEPSSITKIQDLLLYCCEVFS